jgi:hypothetical protein
LLRPLAGWDPLGLEFVVATVVGQTGVAAHHGPVTKVGQFIAVSVLMVQIGVTDGVADLVADHGVVRFATGHEHEVPGALELDLLVGRVYRGKGLVHTAEIERPVQRCDAPLLPGLDRA